jgi:hypothetical protein
VERYPHSWAIHEPLANDGSGIQPHLHVQFSTRREDVANLAIITVTPVRK